MKVLFSILLFSFIVTHAQARQSVDLVCKTADAVDINIGIDDLGSGKERLIVSLGSMNGSKENFYNSSFLSRSLSAALRSGKVSAIASKSDLRESFGGAYVDAVMVEINYNRSTKQHDIVLAAKGNVYLAVCTLD